MKYLPKNLTNGAMNKPVFHLPLKKYTCTRMKTVLKLTSIVCLILISNLVFGVSDYPNFEKIHPKIDAKKPSNDRVIKVDYYDKMASCNKWKDYFRFTKINTIFSFEIDPENTVYCNPSPNANQIITMEVSYTGTPYNQTTGALLTPVSGSFTLKLVFNPTNGKLETKRATKFLENFVYVTYDYQMKVDGTPFTPPSTQCMPSVVFSIENQVDRNYKINTDFYNTISNNTISVPPADINVESCQNKTKLTITNNLVTTSNCNDNTFFMHDIPEFYELEYTFVDFNIRNYDGTTLGYFNFKNNATRVQFKGSSFDIPCIYPRGYVLYRVRMVAYDLLNPTKLVYSNWSVASQQYPYVNSFYFNDISGSELTAGPTDSYTSKICGFMIIGHEDQKNWQYSVAFAEEAKNKGVISYFDGSLRNRQTITRMNSENNTIVGQTIYDWYGRPAISVLPVPADQSTQNDYCFKPNFNISDVSGKQYDWKDFDQDIAGGNCTWKVANAMRNTTGASKYYSQNNAGLNIASSLHQSMFIPNALDYPFAQTEFTPDATNRPSRQGGLGKTHQLPGHTSSSTAQVGKFTGFSYEVPSQEELFLLFGSDIGNHEYYRKNITTDPNGQNSVTYIDPDGKTIATALVGSSGNSSNLEALNSSNDVLEILTGIPSEAKATHGTIPNQLVSSFTKHFTETTTIKLNYDFETQTYLDACNGNVCYDCIYDLNIKIVNPCGEENTVFSGRVDEITQFDLTCSQPIQFKLSENGPLEYTVGEGTYTIIKTLTVNKDAFDFYRDNYMADQSCVKPLDDFITEEFAKIEYTDCFRTCEDCEDEKNTLQGLITTLTNQLSNQIPGSPEWVETNKKLGEEQENMVDMVDECKHLCGELTECDILLEQIKLDMMPGGDYAQYINVNKLEDGIWEDVAAGSEGYIYRSNSGVYYYQNPKNTGGVPTPYKNADGTDAYVSVQCVSAGVFQPPTVSNATLYDLEKNSVASGDIVIGETYLLKPHQLSNYRDFIDVFQEEWVEQLIHYHPELCMYTKCMERQESYKYDMDMMNTDDPAEAILKGYLNPIGTSSANQGFECSATGVRSSVPLNFPAFTSPNAYDPFYGYTTNLPNPPYPANTNLKQKLIDALSNYNGTNYTIWELYYMHLENLNPNLAHTTCLSGESWEFFRALYINAKRKVLSEYIYDYDYNNNWCSKNIDLTLQYNSTIKRKFIYREAERNDKLPVNPFTSTNLQTAITDQCHENCLNNVSVWMEKLAGCSITPAQRTDLENALLSVCERSCNAENIMGGQKVLPENRLSSGPNTTREAIYQIVGYMIPNICDDILLSFPTTFDDDPNSTNDPDADTCACNQYATDPVIRIGCPEEELPPPPELSTEEQQALALLNAKLNTCICPVQNPKLKSDLLSRENIPEDKKCKNCINCDELAIALSKFFEIRNYDLNALTDPSPLTIENVYIDQTHSVNLKMLDYNLPENQKLLENYLNKYFGFYLTYADYFEMAKKCIGTYNPTMDDDDVWHLYFEQSNNIPDYKRIFPNHIAQHPEEDKVQIATCGCDKLLEADKLVTEGKYASKLLALQHLLGKQIDLTPSDLVAMTSLCCEALTIASPPDPPDPPVIDWFSDGVTHPCTNSDYRPGNWGYNQRNFFRTILINGPANSALDMIINKLSPCKDNYFTPCPKLCNKPMVFIADYTDPCVELLETFALLNAKQRYIDYLKEKEENFKLNYYKKCMTAEENFAFSYQLAQYHYTLYYYDQAGNLVKTVPPAGVDIQHWFDEKEQNSGAADPQTLCNNRIDACWDYKKGISTTFVAPTHRLITLYQYNTLNQLVVQNTPDAGESQFWYDKLGRLVASQNAKQVAAHKYSYTFYNSLGLILEVGEIAKSSNDMTHALAADPTALTAWLDLYNISINNKTQVTRTVYNRQYLSTTESKFSNGIQSNLRNRVVSIFIQKQRGTLYNPGLYEHAVHYSYDIHGNVKELVQEVSELDRFGKRWSNITYQYDLISGNVNQVNYQPGKLDAYHHRYTYDDDNRLVEVQTSQEGRVWETDARYKYYQHGPLARTELGQEQVQGIDYAYTLSGWLKGVNGDILKPDNDMGKDGTNLIPVLDHSYFARDIFGYTLGYYTSDYTPIGIGNSQYKPMQIKRYNTSIPSDMATTTKELFNGNISYMTIALPDFATFANGTAFTPKPVANTFRYDQLNRITKARFFDETTVNTLGETLWAKNSKTGEDAYYSTYKYDANGNITNLTRNNSAANVMDNLTYRYDDVDPAYSGKGKYSNKLYHVNDASSSNTAPEIKDQGSYTMISSTNYSYDEIGNLIKDKSEEIQSIEWNVYGKISKITRDRTGSPVCTKPDLEFVYDGTGNRLIKKVKPWNSGSNSLEPAAKWQYTYYLRDAQGNTMAVYSSANDTTYRLNEHHIYGSSRLGMQTYRGGDNVTGKHLIKNTNLVQRVPPDSMVYNVRGLKQYELSNHLGNVQATISDKKLVVMVLSSTTIEYYLPDVQSMTDYYPFGMVMDGRSYNAGNGYRYGFNGKEKDDETGLQDYGFRIYNTGICQFLSVDPLIYDYPWYTPYQFAGNMPIWAIDLDGLEPFKAADGSYIGNKYSTSIDNTSNSYNISRAKLNYDLAHKLPVSKTYSFKTGGSLGTDAGQRQALLQGWALSYGIPGFDLGIKWANGQKISTSDIGIEAFAAIPFCKFSKIPGFKKMLTAGSKFGGEYIVKNYKKIDPWLRYQAQVTESAIGVTFKYGGREFDGLVKGVLIEAKGVGTMTAIKKYPSKMDDMIKQARDQVKAAGGKPLEWRFAEKDAADAFQVALSQTELANKITIKHIPMDWTKKF